MTLMSRKLVLGTLLAGSGAAALGLLAYASPSVAQSDQAATVYGVNLLPLNSSGATGQATLRLSANGKNLNVHITASGLEAGNVHVSHIHGQPGGAESSCPTIAQDDDGDGFVELLEGQDTYGPIIVDFGNIDPNQDGTVDFRTTVKLQGDLAGALPLENRHIVVHGRSVGAVGAGTPGEVDGTPGFKVVLPVLCGEIVQQGRSQDALEFRDVPRRN